jgi:hypothetical protein
LNRRTVVAFFALVAFVMVVMRTVDLRAIATESGIRAALVYTPEEVRPGNEIRAAYAETLRENGIAFDWIAATDLSLFGADALHRMYAAIVFPDRINTRIPEESVRELTRYAAEGGLVAVIDDAGTRAGGGAYRPASLFTRASGVNPGLYQQLRAKAFASGPLHFRDAAAAARWQVPPGKIIDGDLSGYLYGPLKYPFPRAEVAGDDVAVDAGNGSTPLISRRVVGRGEIAYIGLPLGYLRGYSDAFPMTFLTSLLTSRNTLPHLVAAPDGIGELVVNIHIDSSVEFMGIPNLQRRGLLRRDVPMEFDVTAGPDLDRVGDGLGFAACGRGPGRAYLKLLARYGTIGSHGGWAHNLFASTLDANRYTPAQVRALVDRNDRCLASVTGQPVRSYAAPAGVHPQPMMTQALDSLGIEGYYYTGDTGGPVLRPFYNGTLVSAHSWAFPVMPSGRLASIGEMRAVGIPGPPVERWLEQTAEYAAARHGIFLAYSHSYDLLPGHFVAAFYDAEQQHVVFHTDSHAGEHLPAPYALAFGHFLDRVEALERAHKLRTTSMPAAASFMDRFVATTSSFTLTAEGVHVTLHNARGLRSIAFALPSAWLKYGAPPPPGVRWTSNAGGYAIFAITNNRPDLDVTFTGAS